jgi:glycosyltransferase involved in cell wall biosynthesis
VRPIRVLTLVDLLEPSSGGAERFAVGLAARLPRDRFEVALCATRAVRAPWDETLRRSGVRWFALGRRSTADVLPLARLARVLRRQRVDVLHAHMFGSNVWGTIVGRASRVPVVIAHEHTWDYQGQPLRRLLDGRLIGRLADAFVAVSEADRARMVAVEGVPAAKVRVEPPGYVPRPGPRAPTRLREELGLAASVPLVGTAAIPRPQKALDVLLDAFARVRDSAHLVIAGDGSGRAALERRAGELRIADRTHFLGLRDDVDGILAALDVAAMSSDFEGTPLFAFECMAAGTPLVATAVGGLPDVLEHGRSAILVPPRDPAALAAGIDGLLEDPEARSAIAAAAAARLEPYRMDAVAERFGALYTELLARR